MDKKSSCEIYQSLKALKCPLCFAKNTFKYLKDKFVKQYFHFHLTINKKMNEKIKITKLTIAQEIKIPFS